MTIVLLQDKLNRVNWDFAGAWTREGIHSLHWFPGRFIPQIPGTLVQLLTKPGDVVLDPFCGCGTTLVESIKLGRPAVGLDTNPVAILASRAKVSHFVLEMLQSKLSVITSPLFVDQMSRKALPLRAELEDWFSPKTLEQLSGIWAAIGAVCSEEERRFFNVCFSHILKSCSSQEKHWGYVADNVKPKRMKYRDAVQLMHQHCARMIDAFRLFYERLGAMGPTSVAILKRSQARPHDTCHPIDLGFRVDAVITSPPYPGVTDYARAHRLSYYWFGWDLKADEQQEVGARWKRFRRQHVEEYRRDMLSALTNISAVLKSGGLFGVVSDSTGRSRISLSGPARVDIAEMLTASLGYLRLCDDRQRRISGQRLLDRNGSQNLEVISILRKP